MKINVKYTESIEKLTMVRLDNGIIHNCPSPYIPF